MENISSNSDYSWLLRFAIFDRSPLVEYENLVGLRGLEVAINECIEESRFRMDTIITAVDADGIATIEREARVLKSMCESCGFSRLAELCRVIEHAANVRTTNEIRPLIDELERTVDLSLHELELFANQLGASLKIRRSAIK